MLDLGAMPVRTSIAIAKGHCLLVNGAAIVSQGDFNAMKEAGNGDELQDILGGIKVIGEIDNPLNYRDPSMTLAATMLVPKRTAYWDDVFGGTPYRFTL